MKGKGKKQTCEKKNQTWAQRNQNRKTGNCQTRRHQHDGLASSVEEITNLANNIVPLGGADCSSCGKDNHFVKCYQSTNRNRTHGVREEYEESSGDADDRNEESSSESDYIDCMTLTSNSISTVEHCENAQEIYADPERKSNPLSCRLWGNCQCAACKVCRTRRD